MIPIFFLCWMILASLNENSVVPEFIIFVERLTTRQAPLIAAFFATSHIAKLLASLKLVMPSQNTSVVRLMV